MYRFRVPEIFLGCFLTVAVFAAGMLFERSKQSSRPAQSISKQETASEGSKAQNPDADLTGSTWLTKDAAGFFTFGLVIIGIGQAILFWFQLRYMRQGMDDATMAAKAAAISADTAREQVALTKIGIVDLERAYIAVGPTQIFRRPTTVMGAPSGRRETAVKLLIHNTGRTSATIVTVYGEFSRNAPAGDVPIYENGSSIETDLSIAIGAESILPLDFADPYLEPQYFWGYIEYIDIFREKRTSRFCCIIFPEDLPASGRFTIAGSFAWRAGD